MASDLQNLQSRRSAVLAILAAGGVTAPDGSFVSFDRPDYSKDGQTVSPIGWKMSYLEELKSINELISSVDGAFEICDRGYT